MAAKERLAIVTRQSLDFTADVEECCTPTVGDHPFGDLYKS
jgi:hypothetical protein